MTMIMQENLKWKQVWEKRTLKDLDLNNPKSVYMELKRCDGFDVLEDGISYDGFRGQYERLKRELEYGRKEDQKFQSVFEVGCGSGADLYLFQQEGKICGGIDYSNALIEIARQILGDHMQECVCDEAVNLDAQIKYDVILSNSVFSYFPDYEYARKVLAKMYDKCLRNIAVLDIFDKDKEQAFHECRRKIIPDYDVRYDGLDKLFYPKTFWLDFAEQNNMDIKFSKIDVDGYWNNEFIYACFLYKND